MEKEKKFIAVTFAGLDQNGDVVPQQCALIRIAYPDELLQIFVHCINERANIITDEKHMSMIQTLMMLAGEVIFRREIHGELIADSDINELAAKVKRAQEQPPSKNNPQMN